MKNKSSGSKASKFLLAFNCLILAIIFWLAIKFGEIGELPPLGF